MTDAIDSQIMQRCLTLARTALGQTAPNPLVGSVIVRDRQIVGEGFHPKAGQPHAEVFALRAAGDRAQGATLYVNLEPCNHYGRTPPCSEAIIQAGVARVVVGMVDPDPRVSGGGIARLREAGVEVLTGVEEADCQKLNEAFVYRVRHQRSLGILKYAMTLDGKIATTTGHSAWVTGPESRHWVHQLRASCEAVVIGGNTVRRDNPLLTSHGVADHNPMRVVMSRQLDLPVEAQLWQTAIASTLVFTTTQAPSEMQRMLTDKGVEVIVLPQLTCAAVMNHLYNRGCLSVLWECGGTLAAEAIREGVIQKIAAFIAPKLIGGVTAPSPVGDLNLYQMTDALPVDRVMWRSLGSDLLIEGYLPEPSLLPQKTRESLECAD